ncbi:MAG: sigma-54 dependent transcriptional regulator [Planctomycetota bacterium]
MSSPGARVCVVDDDPAIREALAERLAAQGYAVTTAESGEEALERARAGLDVMLLDLSLPRGDGISVLESLQAEGVEVATVVITAYASVDRAVRAMRAGAYDFLQKPFEPEVVDETVRRALERQTLRRANRALAGADGVAGLVHAPEGPLEAALGAARRAARSDATVLLHGESGTGKELLARAIHRWSARAEGPFVPVNCAALAESLLESELFGHERGAFTGATERREGRLEAAHGGTLFLDEVGDTSPALQVKLLRVLQERCFERVGGNRTVSVDLRVVTATHRDLRAMVAAGDFREDLFYRLNVIALTLPPLRERRADVGLLAEHFVRDFAAQTGRAGLKLSTEARRALLAHDWPGNVRELRNAIERAVVLCEGDEIAAEDLPGELFEQAVPAVGFHARVEAYRRQVIEEALAETGGNQTRAAERLGLQRTYLSRLIRKYGI